MDAEQRVWLAGAAQEKPIQWRVKSNRDLAVLLAAVLAVSCMLAAVGAGISRHANGSPLAWLPFAWTMGVAYIAPRRYAWHIVVVSMLGIMAGHNFLFGFSAAFPTSLGYALELVPAILVMRFYFDSKQTSALIQFAIFIVVLVFLAPFTGGLICSAVFGIVLGSPMTAVLSDALNQGVASAIAVIAMMPLFISRAAWNVLLERQVEAMAILVVNGAVTYFVFSNDHVWMMVLPALIATIASLRFGLAGTGGACTIGVMIAAWQTAHGLGPLAVLADGPLKGLEFVILQFLCFTSCFLCGLIGAQTEDAERRGMGLQAYGDAVMGTSDGIVVLDTSGKIILANPAVSQITGNTATEIIGNRVQDFGDGIDDLSRRTKFRLLRGEEVYQVPARIRRRDRSKVDIVFNATPLMNGDKLVGAVMVIRDTTEQERLRAEISKTSAMTRALVQSVDHSVIGVDAEGRINHWNNAATEQFGIEAHNALGMNFTDLPGPPAKERMKRYRSVMNGGSVKGLTITVPDGQGGEKLLDVTINPVVDDDGTVIGTASVSRDVTELRAAEKLAAETRDALADALSSVEDGLAFFDQDDRLTHCNDAFASSFRDYFDARSGNLRYQQIMQLIVEPEVLQTDDSASTGWLKKHLAQRQAERSNPTDGVSDEFHLKNGRWYLGTNYGRSGKGSIFVIRDITALKRRELELRESNRDLEQFAQVASHDLKEPLRKIQTFGSILENEHAVNLGADAQEIVKYMTDGADRLERLIDDLLELSLVNRHENEVETVDLNESLDAVCATLSDGIQAANAVIRYHNLPSVCGRNSAIDRVFSNLISNSIKYRDPLRPLEITIAETTAANGWAAIRFSDNGIGFDPQYSDTIFEPFVRVNSAPGVSGSGMGLAIVRKIVQRFGGSIEARGNPGMGANFLITLRCPSNRLEEANENREFETTENRLRRG